jgi:hypothetical protein
MFWTVCTFLRWTILWIGTLVGVIAGLRGVQWDGASDERIAVAGALGGLVGFGVAYVIRLIIPKKN